MEEIAQVIDLKDLLSSEFFRKQRLLDDFHVKYENTEYWVWLCGLYDDWLNQQEFAQIVPKKIHQIWLGSPLPKKYFSYQKSWQVHNPDYEYKLWTEKDILDLELHNEKQYKASKNFGVKSDIARYEILYRFGGIYADTDFECLNPFDERFLCRSFIAGQVFSYSPQLSNGLMIAATHDKFLELIIENIPNYPGEMSPMDVLQYCGAIFISDLAWRHRKSLSDFLVLPSQYFYPWPNYKLHQSADRYSWSTEETKAIHHWETSWMRVGPVKRIEEILKRIIKG
jgi:mannosyltransferase OCH1-like enzyme